VPNTYEKKGAFGLLRSNRRKGKVEISKRAFENLYPAKYTTYLTLYVPWHKSKGSMNQLHSAKTEHKMLVKLTPGVVSVCSCAIYIRPYFSKRERRAYVHTWQDYMHVCAPMKKKKKRASPVQQTNANEEQVLTFNL